MLPTPATNPWSTSSGLSRPRRPRMRAPERLEREPRSSSGSGPIPSNGSSSATYSPIRPNLRTSRNRISRPSSSAIARRSYGSTGRAAGTTNTWPVILRWTVRNAPPARSTMTCLPRRPIASIRRPVTPSTNAAGSSSRSVRVHETRAPVISGPGPPPSGSRWRRRSRATVSTSGSSGIAVTIGQVPAGCDARTGVTPAAPRAPWIAHDRRDRPHARARRPDRRERAVLRERRDRRLRAAPAARDQGLPRPDERRARGRRRRRADRRAA